MQFSITSLEGIYLTKVCRTSWHPKKAVIVLHYLVNSFYENQMFTANDSYIVNDIE